MNRTEVINFYTAKFALCRYLEIGVGNLSANFNKIVAAVKDGVDPINVCNNPMTSDTFFHFHSGRRYDVIFVDGDHRAVQAKRDIDNALKVLNPEGGVIIVHDCNPPDEPRQLDIPCPGPWNGSVWKAAVLYRYDPNVTMFTINTDQGLGIIKPIPVEKKRRYFDISTMTYAMLEAEREELLNLISVEDWKALEGV